MIGYPMQSAMTYHLTNFVYKIELVRTLTDRAFKINSSKELLDNDLGKISETLQKNNAFFVTLVNVATFCILLLPLSQLRGPLSSMW